ncbi:D-ribose-binding periplasmic protein precursor [compost metagenome]
MIRRCFLILALWMGAAAPAHAEAYRLALVCKSLDGEYWGTVSRAAQREAKRQGVTIVLRAPERESDSAAQIRFVEQLIAQRVDGIALAPVDSKALGPIVRKALKAGIKVVTIDTDTVDKDRLAYIGTDNLAAGRKAGEELLGLKPQGKVAIVTGVPTAQNLRQRVEGFRRAMLGTRIRLLSEQADQGSRENAVLIAEETLAAHPDLSAFFTDNAIAGPAIGEVVRRSGRPVAVVAFDATPAMMKLVRSGTVQVVIAQKPEQMGQLGVRTLVQALQGKAIPAQIPTEVEVITARALTR